MRQKHKDAWIAALRSGEYEQGGGTLRQEGPDWQVKHCCLGVLVEVLNDQFPEVLEELDVTVEYRTSIVSPTETLAVLYPDQFEEGERSEEHNELPDPLREWAFGGGNEMQLELIQMNDVLRESFDDIADFIDRNVVVPA